MGWWEQRSSRWEVCVVAQMGGAALVGAGVYFIQFRSADLPIRPIYVAIAGGVGAGGSIGSAVSIPYRSLVRQLINPRAAIDTSNIGWNALDGTFAAKNMNRSRLDIAQATASAVIVGGQFVTMRCTEVHLLSANVQLFSSRIQWPQNLRQVGNAVLDTPQIQGGFGAGAFAFTGIMQYIGT